MEQTAQAYDPASTETFAHCYEAVKQELAAISEHDCLPVNLDPQDVAMSIKRALPRARPLRDRIVQHTPTFEVALLDQRLDTYAGALFHAQVLVDMVNKQPAAVQKLADRGGDAREVLVADVGLMIKRDLLPHNCLANLQGALGYRPVAADIMLCVNTLRANQDKVKGRTSITNQELEEYESLAAALVNAAAEREQAQANAPEVALNRARVYTLCVRGYERLRHVVAYNRQEEGDGEEITPSLWAGRGTRRKPEPQPSESAPSASQGASSVPGVDAKADSKALKPASNGAQHVPVGLPGGDPLLNA